MTCAARFFAPTLTGPPTKPHIAYEDHQHRLTRALGAGEIKFTGQVTPDAKLVSYHLDLKRVIERKLVMGIADGYMKVDGEVIYTAKDLRVGLFKQEDA